MSEPKPTYRYGIEREFGQSDIGAAVQGLHEVGMATTAALYAKNRLYEMIFEGSLNSKEYTDPRFTHLSQLKIALQELGLNPLSVKRHWDLSDSSDNVDIQEKRAKRNEMYANNLSLMMDLEIQRPGSISIFDKSFGINCFTRYVPDMKDTGFLISQYDNRKNRDLPYIFFATAYNSHNIVYEGNGQVLKKLQAELGEDMLVRAHEYNGIQDINGLVRRLIQSHARYGPRGENGHKIPLGVIRTHSDGKDLQVTRSPEGWLRTTDEVFSNSGQDPAIDALRDVFTDDAVLILGSCYSGEEGNMANHMANRFGLTVFGPKEKATIGAINIATHDERRTFTPSYVLEESGETRDIQAGKYDPFAPIKGGTIFTSKDAKTVPFIPDPSLVTAN